MIFIRVTAIRMITAAAMTTAATAAAMTTAATALSAIIGKGH
jgi:hypothetical protein